MPRGVKSYTDDYAKLFQLLGNKDRLAIYGCLRQQANVSVTELCEFMGWESDDGSADLQAMRRHLKELRHWGIVTRCYEDNEWLSNEDRLKDYLAGAINDLCK